MRKELKGCRKRQRLLSRKMKRFCSQEEQPHLSIPYNIAFKQADYDWHQEWFQFILDHPEIPWVRVRVRICYNFFLISCTVVLGTSPCLHSDSFLEFCNAYLLVLCMVVQVWSKAGCGDPAGAVAEGNGRCGRLHCFVGVSLIYATRMSFIPHTHPHTHTKL
jgi:hypothetical protein